MATRYFCDICGAEVRQANHLSKISLVIPGLVAMYRDSCSACKNKVRARARELLGPDKPEDVGDITSTEEEVSNGASVPRPQMLEPVLSDT